MKALEVPEILRVLGEFLDYPRLTAATAVCKSWNTIFTPFLYHTIEFGHHFSPPRSFVIEDHVDQIRVIKLYSTPWNVSLTDCTNLEEIQMNPNFGKRFDKDASWMPLAKLVRQNPRLATVCVVEPSDEFLRAVFTCCPQLKRLDIRQADMKDTIMTTLFLNVCFRLEELRMEDMTLNVGGVYDVPWSDWPSFPKINKLWIGTSNEEQWDPRQLQQQHQLITRCPNLEALTWSFSKSPLPIHQLKTLLSRKNSPCPKLKAFEFHFPGFHFNLTEDKLLEILKGCSKKLTSFGARHVDFEEPSSQVLIKSFASTLTRLRIDNSSPEPESGAMMKILSSCPHLIHFINEGRLDVRDILGIKYTKPSRDWGRSGGDSAATKKKATGRSPKEQPLPKSIDPPDWACKNLQTLKTGICGLEGKPLEWKRAALKQLAALTQLKVLDVRPPFFYATPQNRDGFAFRLAAGLDILGNLTMLETLCFGEQWQEMTKEEVEWMVKAWPRFSYIQGLLHHEQSQRSELKRLFKRHGITVQYCQGFEPLPGKDETPDSDSIVDLLSLSREEEDRYYDREDSWIAHHLEAAFDDAIRDWSSPHD